MDLEEVFVVLAVSVPALAILFGVGVMLLKSPAAKAIAQRAREGVTSANPDARFDALQHQIDDLRDELLETRRRGGPRGGGAGRRASRP